MSDQSNEDHQGDAKTLSPLLPQDVEEAACWSSAATRD